LAAVLTAVLAAVDRSGSKRLKANMIPRIKFERFICSSKKIGLTTGNSIRPRFRLAEPRRRERVPMRFRTAHKEEDPFNDAVRC
jgi:hypothetical protein